MNGVILSTFVLLAIVACIQGARVTDDRTLLKEGLPPSVWHIVESIPMGLDLHTNMTTYEAWSQLFTTAVNTIEMAEFYISLTGGTHETGGEDGKTILKELIGAVERGVDVLYVENAPSYDFPDNDTLALIDAGATVLNINWTTMLTGGILHTKLIVVDHLHVYLGSANFDWRSLTQVKELGVFIENSPLIATEVSKIIRMYAEAANDSSQIPSSWPQQDATMYNSSHPFTVSLNGTRMEGFVASSPQEFCAINRTWDLDAILFHIANAQQYVNISVMDYIPITQFLPTNIYWPPIDDALRSAAFNGIQVSLLISNWTNSDPIMFQYLRSLDEIENITVQLFVVPPQEGVPPVPYTRVNHAKYMVTDQAAYITTSNWVGDYFINTGGVSLSLMNPVAVSALSSIFLRDWYSVYAHPLSLDADESEY